MKIPIVLLLPVFLFGCSKSPTENTRHQFDPKSSGMIFSSFISPTPIDNATTRYTDFKIHVRAEGDKNYVTFTPQKVEATKDKSVKVQFAAMIDPVRTNHFYEYYYSYKLDGKEQVDSVSRTMLVSTKP